MGKCGDVGRPASHGVEVFIQFWRPYLILSSWVVTSRTYSLDKCHLIQYPVFPAVCFRSAVVTAVVTAVVAAVLMAMAVMAVVVEEVLR
jgi:hypothetical protein